jgi:hypothetical protein
MPITHIDGDKLKDLMIEYGIGVRKKTVDVSEVQAGVSRVEKKFELTFRPDWIRPTRMCPGPASRCSECQVCRC